MSERTVPARPRARAEGVVVRELPEEVLVYDLDTHKAVCLNSTAAMVWRLCDGRRTASEIRRSLEKASGGRVPEELVWLALEQLGRDNLLDTRVPRPDELAGLSRRELIKRVGLAAAVALPAVASIVAPTPAQAGSCLPSGASCSTSADCCSACGVDNKCI
ncbi:MAG: PqqD family protein [Acidobacteria bacterium]|nr:PqqD family protein [Acidobacteriota bacterium]